MKPSVLFFLIAAASVCHAAPFTATVIPTADTFAREAEPANNYGLAGSLAVSGRNAYSYTSPTQQMGRFDSFLCFPAAALVQALDANFGSHYWSVTKVTLNLTEVTQPNNPIFNLGPGTFEVMWIANDSWLEGTGTPNAPTADGLRFQDVAAVIDPLTDASLGIFNNVGGGTGTPAVTCILQLPPAFIADLRAGGEITLHLAPADENIGFTFNSRNISGGRPKPNLAVTANLLAGDTNLDCSVNILDLIFIRQRLNQDVSTADNRQADVNADGRINILDLIAVRNLLNTKCQ